MRCQRLKPHPDRILPLGPPMHRCQQLRLGAQRRDGGVIEVPVIRVDRGNHLRHVRVPQKGAQRMGQHGGTLQRHILLGHVAAKPVAAPGGNNEDGGSGLGGHGLRVCLKNGTCEKTGSPSGMRG